ncbi:MAG TPA: hypothetical protein VHC43_00835 [Mycobacteriales bacterium]|nr:hypothetical protein [Mycobacteriales bacterium]
MRLRAGGQRAAITAAAAAFAVACSGTTAAPKPTPSGSAPAPAAAQVLSINVANPPQRWRTVASFTYGKRANQLGPPAGRVAGRDGSAAGGALAFPPAAIAVIDNSLWVLDQNKHRVAHFTLAGHYLGEVRGVSATARDLAAYPDGHFLVIDNETRRTVRTFTTSSRRASRPRVVSSRSRGLARLVPTDTDVGTGPGVSEYDDRFGWSVDLDTLDVRMTPRWDRRYTFPGGHDVVLGVFAAQVARRRAYLWMGVAGARGSAIGGELLLELDPEGDVASLERIETPPDDSQIVRPFYVAASGAVYQWFAAPTHAELRAGA